MQPARSHAEVLKIEDYRALPEGGPRYQLVDGELHLAPSPNLYHQEIVWNLSLPKDATPRLTVLLGRFNGLKGEPQQELREEVLRRIAPRPGSV